MPRKRPSIGSGAAERTAKKIERRGTRTARGTAGAMAALKATRKKKKK